MLRALLAMLGGAQEERAKHQAVLRDERSEGDSRRLVATFSATGDLIIDGYDFGDTVEALLGCREYEWVWTVAAASLPKLHLALEAEDDLLTALARRFHGPQAADLGAFLNAHDIAYEVWSRIGD